MNNMIIDNDDTEMDNSPRYMKLEKLNFFIEKEPIERYSYFSLLKYLLDFPQDLKNDILSYKFSPFHTIAFDFSTMQNISLKLDTYDLFIATFPTKDLINRRILLNNYDSSCRAFFDLTLQNIGRPDTLKNANWLTEVVKIFRLENLILKQYLTFYVYLSYYSTTNLKILQNKIFPSTIKRLLQDEAVLPVDYEFKGALKFFHLLKINKNLASAMFLYYYDTLVLQQRINIFNLRIQQIKLPRTIKHPFKQYSLDAVEYAILKQKIRVHLNVIAICSLLKFKQNLIKKFANIEETPV